MEIEELIQKDEGVKLDFKRDYELGKEKSEYIKDIIALANGSINTIGETAYLIFGIKEIEGAKNEIYGVNIEKNSQTIQQHFINRLNSCLVEPIQELNVKEFELESKRVLVVEIRFQGYLLILKENLKGTQYKKGNFLYRVGEQTQFVEDSYNCSVRKNFEETLNRYVKESVSVINQNIHKIPSELATTLGESPNFKGRKNETNDLIKQLSEHKAVVVHGIGGIGKSSFVSAYLNTHKNEFKYYGFINWTDNIKLDFFNSLHVNMKLEDYNNINKNFDELMRNLRALDGQKLLIIDKVEGKEVNYKEEEKSIRDILNLTDTDYNYKIIFTSRFKINSLTPYFLKPLDKEDAKDIFLTHCKTKKIEKVYKILEYLGYHALFIKLVAETIENEGYTLDDILKKFERGELSKIKFIDEESGDEVTFNQNLQELFSMLNLKDEYVLLLKRLSVLPSIDIELSFLEEILGKERLKGRLNFLVGHGWLIENKGSYKLHQIIKEFILANYHPSYFEEIEIIVEFFSSHTNKHDIWIVFLESIAKFLEKSNFKSKTVLDLYFFTGQVFFNKYSNYESSKKYLLLNEKVWKELNLEYDIESTYHLLARIFEKSEKLDDALAYINQALEIFTDKKEKKSIATCYDDIASIYWNKKLLDKALSFFDKALSIYVELDNLNDIAIVYNNISLVYKDKENYAKSHNFLQEALDLNINDKKNVAQFYNNRGELYTEEGKYELAEEDILLAFKMREELYQNYELDENHDYFAESYDNLAIIYLETKKYKKAKIEQNKAIKIWSYNHDDNYSYLLDARERLVLIEKKLQDE